MNDMKDLYYKLGEEYEVEWNSGDSYSFYLFFEGKRGRKYKLDISEDMVSISKRVKIFHWFIWDELTHLQYDDKDSSIDDVFNGVQYYLERYQ